ncbi:hypothetical protein Pmar_PMAR014568 [Perkinsus marinus ATCC 50983]|uniref:Aminotransferase class V domain-containing protein n=1 Tax=Perkinsus marinus (strain ATCC 50983 / TXsc) TaxID=423536 RepID=C5LIE9_PERM5|nr:hypothetical protein Pmar_PMAR014568 [Perkinsus marinus ATCC 50983]EER03352.1 hypothetical protein Pmar_PMAR014568 [Perkinsus marinus ATCC 50983]|eukprot:XP_002771536.1 hypothetical protein Pmar_PMAR014568 [Perkinsus marinus ATCC 50983]
MSSVYISVSKKRKMSRGLQAEQPRLSNKSEALNFDMIKNSGLLLCKKKRQTNAVPAVCGGGVVLYVSQRGHRYLDNFEEREEAGTPDILGCIRAGIVYHLHRTIGIEKIAAAEHKMADHLYKRLQTHSKIHILGPKASYTRTTAFDDRLRIVLTVLVICILLQCSEYVQGCTLSEIFKPGFVRIGVHFTMTQEEVDLVADAILWIADNGWILLPSYTFKTRSGEWYHIRRDDRQKLRSLSETFDQSSFPTVVELISLGNCSARCGKSSARRSSLPSIGSHKHVDEDSAMVMQKADEVCKKILSEDSYQ